jgi:hypothetical protein
MSQSPIDRLMEALDRLDLDGAMALLAPDSRLLSADGRRAEGTDAVRTLLGSLLGELRATSHNVTAQWHADDAWVAEVEATYELTDGTQTADLRRAFILRESPQGLTDVHVYGAHELPLDDERAEHGSLRVGGRWIPSL